ncbi:MAG TPA: trigger factor [Candidatus Eisenbacteria bacterium]|jgi:trigger factor
MTHTVRETGQWQHTLSIEVPADEVERRLGDVSRRFQQVVSLPGFRKGKVPLERVRQDYAAEIEREFLERFIPEVTQRAIEESALKAVVPPSVHNLRFTPGQPLQFEAVVDVAPELTVRDWKGFALTRRTRPVDDAAVDAMVGQMREESAVFADVDRPAGKGDIVLLDTQRLDANGRRLSGTRNKGTRIQLGAPELLPDLEAGLTGAEGGQERTLAVTYPAEFRQAELAGQTVRYVVNIKKIQEKKLRDLDDNFAKDVFGLESYASLRDRVRRNLELEEAQRARRELEAQAIDELVRRNSVDLSPRLVGYMLDQVVHEQTGGREVSEDLHKQLEEHYRPGVERSLKREILLIAIAKQEQLEVTAEEVGQQILRLVESDPRNAARVRQHYASPERRKALAESMLEKKALDLVVGAAQVKDETLSEPAELPAGR